MCKDFPILIFLTISFNKIMEMLPLIMVLFVSK